MQTVVGLDIAKTVFQLHTVDKKGWLRLLGQEVFRDKWICLNG